MKEQRLPDGTWTKDVDLFTAEWDKLRKPFEDLGFVVIGFDPGIALRDANNWDSSFVLPIWAAKRIIETMRTDKQTIEWRKADDPPPLTRNDLFLHSYSEPVLAWCDDGEMRMVALEQFDDDDTPMWYTQDMDHVCIMGGVLFWAHVSPPS